MRPTEALDSRGQPAGKDTVVIKEWPCSIDTLSGNKAVQARTVFAETRHSVKGWGDPAKRFKARDYLTGGTIGDRKLFVGAIIDKLNNGLGEIELLCGERDGE